MTRPTIIRADTIDLQDPGSPSAADHTRQPTQPAPLGAGPASPHQAAAIRHVEEDRANEEEGLVQSWTSPNGGHHDDHSGTDSADVTDDGDMADSETEDMDDDMLDKISSSPSIDDGRYSPRAPASAWPTRSSSLHALPLPATPSQQRMYQHSNVSPESDQGSSSPFTLTPQHLPLSYQPKPQSTPPRFSTPLSSPPFNTPLMHRPARMVPHHDRPSSTDHHRLGEYTRTEPTATDIGCDDPFDREFEDGLQNCYHEDANLSAGELSDDVGPLRSEQYELESRECNFGGDREGEMLVFPADRPLPPIPVSDSANDLRELLATRQSNLSLERVDSPETMSWETDSNASSFDPEENDDKDNDDDDDDDLEDIFLSLDDDRHDSAYGGECLRETEDIDFEFVYALHTFVATVEGQANATKGDTMVLLDDSNSYWWLVRIVKDSSIGYLPAEHIETPTERLARLNKHRNIDLSAAMLGDSAEKSKNPLKKAMRRRNAKTVQFTAPTYVEASDYDYSSDEEDDDGEDFGGGPVHVEDEQEHEEDDGREGMTVEPLRIGGKKDDAEKKSDESKSGDDKARTSDEMFDRPVDQKVSRNGTVRNTDSFFKDETVETRKITLTPNLLRDDSSASTVRSEGRERGGSLDSLEKELKSPDSKPKDDKKKKEKKPGMLRGLFGRKDKKAKSADSEQNDEKQSEELARESLSRDSEETASPKEPAKAENESSQQQQQPVRQTNKASKSSEKKTNGPQKSQPSDPNVQPAKSILQKTASQGAAEATMRLVSAGAERNQQAEEDDSEAAARAQGQAQAQAELQARAQEEAKYQAKEAEKEAAREAAAGRARSGSTSAKQAISNILHSKSSEREQKQENKMPPREKVKKSKARAPLDDFDSTPEYEQDDPFADPNEEERQPNGAPQQQNLRPEDTNSRAPESLGDVSPLDTDQPPALMHDTSSQEEPDISPVSPSGSPLRGELSISSPTATRIAPTPGAINTNIPLASANSPTANELPSAVSLPAWSDASLRSYLDDGSDIRDMLVVVNDTSGVVPVGPEHPIMAGLFSDERSKVAAMGMQLDSLLGDWLSRKRRRNEGGRKQSC